jgi:MerR family mercuric resistance operon transcriptional regulator
MLSIGQVAKQLGVGVETVRFYERQGLLEEPERRPSGFRQYDESIVKRITFIKQAKKLGFTLNEIKDLLSLRHDPDTDCEVVKLRAMKKIRDVHAKIDSLVKITNALLKITRNCPGKGELIGCHLLEFLELNQTNGD